MKRVFITLLLLLLSTSLFALAGLTLGISPMSGTFDIPLGSPYYPVRDNYVNGESISSLTWTNNRFTELDSYNLFADRQIIGIASVDYQKLSGSDGDYYFSIDFQSDTGAFEFVSQSNDAYSRPFKLYAIYNSRLSSDQGRVGIYEIKSGYSTERVPLNFNPYDQTKQAIWFDILVALPGGGANETTGYWKDHNILDYNGKRYFLADLDDYVAMLTATITITDKNGNYVDSVSVSYPMTGNFKKSDYEGTPDILGSINQNYSLLVNPLPQALNLNLSKKGQPFTIATIDYVGNFNKSSDINKQSPIIFLSSKENPFDKSENKFKFIHRDAGAVLSGRNSIGYTALVVNNSDRIEYDGSEYLDSQGDIYRSDGSTVNNLSIEKETAKMIASGTQSYSTYWHQYKAEIQIIIDQSNALMWPGQYESTIYVHLCSK